MRFVSIAITMIFVLMVFSKPASAQVTRCDRFGYCFTLVVTPTAVVGGTAQTLTATLTVNPVMAFSRTFYFFGGDFTTPSCGDQLCPVTFPAGVPSITLVGTSIRPYGTEWTGDSMTAEWLDPSPVFPNFFVQSNFYNILPSSIVIHPDKTTVAPGGFVTLTLSHSVALLLPETVYVLGPSSNLLATVVIPPGGSTTYVYQAPNTIPSPPTVTLTATNFLNGSGAGLITASTTLTIQAVSTTFRVQIHTIIGPQLPFDLTPPNLTIPQQLLKLGQTATVEVMPLQNGTPGLPLTTTASIADAAPTFPTDSAVFSSTTALFKDKVLLHFPLANTGTSQNFFGIHSGTASVSLAFQYNGTNYTVQLPMQVSTCSDGTCTETIGTRHTDLDGLFLKFADRNGIPPQLLKSQISNESGFNPRDYRYEPLSVDFAQLEFPDYRGAPPPFEALKVKALRPWALAEATDCTSKTIFLTAGAKVTDLTSPDVIPRQEDLPFRLKLALGPDNMTPLCQVWNPAQIVSTGNIDNDPLPSIENVLFTNDDLQHWFSNASGHLIVRYLIIYEALVPSEIPLPHTPSTAETVVASSYGLHQVLYTSAVEWGYTDSQGVGLPPSDLFIPAKSLDLGSQYLAKKFQESHVSEAAGFSDMRDLFLQFGPALRGYNLGTVDITLPNVKTQCALSAQTYKYKYACGIIKDATTVWPVQ
jgi:hypothetical protein